MPQNWNTGTINPATTSPATDIPKITDALDALKSCFSGAALPTTNLVAGMFAFETTNNVYWRRDQANASWQLFTNASDTMVVAQAGVLTVGISSFDKTYICMGTFVAGFASAATLTKGWRAKFRNDGTGVITLTPFGGQFIDGAASIALAAGQSCEVCCDGAALHTIGLSSVSSADPSLLYKLDPYSPAFTKTAAGTVSVKAGTSALVFGTKLTWAANTAVTMPTLTAGTDYAIYACQDGTICADASFTAPTGYTTANSRMIGGFHYGLVAPATTVAGGSFATTGSGMVWVQSDVDNIAGINKYSLWDLKFRPACSNPAGMVLVNNRTWVDIYLCSTDTAANGTSKAGTNIASGTVLPKIPAAFGGNGTTTYAAGDWWSFNEIARANGKRFMLASEFYDAAYGVTESQSIDATGSTYPATQRNAGYTSKYGIEQASGHHYTWGMDASGTTPTAWVTNGGRGQSYNNTTIRVVLGGSRSNGAYSGSRCTNFSSVTSNSYWNFGLRAACDHMQLV